MTDESLQEFIKKGTGGIADAMQRIEKSTMEENRAEMERGMEKMKEKMKVFKEVFLSSFRLSAMTFGGGYVMIPMLKKRFVQELGWLDGEEMDDLIAIAQSAPGAVAVNTAVMVGYR